MARHFPSCVAIDISQHMIQKADALYQYAHCQYLVGSGTRLPFADSTFTFIYSNIVLQHMPARFSEQYLREFVRVLAPSAILVFGVQDSFIEGDASLLRRIRRLTRIRTRLQDLLGLSKARVRMYCLQEGRIRRALRPAEVVDIQFTSAAASNFNGNLLFLGEAPAVGWVSKQYCVFKPPQGELPPNCAV